MKFQLVFALLLASSLPMNGAAQKKVPVLETVTGVISIQEGDFLHKNCWTPSPEIKLDEFVTNSFAGERTICFLSDIDTLSFTVLPNKPYDFVILFNGKKARTRISTDVSKDASLPFLEYYRDDRNKVVSVDTLPFRLSDDNRIYLKGKINGSEEFELLFDTGANGMVISTSLIGNKVALILDEKRENNGFDGKHTVEVSSGNKLEIADLNWDKVDLLSMPYTYLDGIIGWVAFENKIVEIDYDRKVLLIHQSMETVPKDYVRVETKMIGNIPNIWGTLTIGDKICSGWFSYDSGADGSLSLSQKFAAENELNGSMKITGTTISTGSAGISWKGNLSVLPKFQLGEFETYLIPVIIMEKDPEGVESSDILGNNLLKRFNAVMDLKNFVVYLKPNNLIHSGY